MSYIVLYGFLAVLITTLFKVAVVVPQEHVYIVERLGKYTKSLSAGFHLLMPFVDKVAYRRMLKEEAIDVEPQVCITSDNVQVQVDGILYLKVFDPVKASYGIDNYHFAVVQLAKTTMRSEIGKIELDKTFSGRESLNVNIVQALDEASDNWGIKVTRYEIRDIAPTATILDAMISQMRAERVKRASILSSEGKREARINVSLGRKQEAINTAMGEKQRRINLAEGRSKAIEITGEATARGLDVVAKAISKPGGNAAVKLRLAETYINRFKSILNTANVSIYPKEVASIAALTDILKKTGGSK